jgi:hypothetical protein
MTVPPQLKLTRLSPISIGSPYLQSQSQVSEKPFWNKEQGMDNAQIVNNCINIPSLQILGLTLQCMELDGGEPL